MWHCAPSTLLLSGRNTSLNTVFSNIFNFSLPHTKKLYKIYITHVSNFLQMLYGLLGFIWDLLIQVTDSLRILYTCKVYSEFVW
jgi:hypothetical protein